MNLACFLYYCLRASAFTFKGDVAFTALAFLEIDIFQMICIWKFISRISDRISRIFIKIHSAHLGFRRPFQNSFRGPQISRTFSQVRGVCKVLGVRGIHLAVSVLSKSQLFHLFASGSLEQGFMSPVECKNEMSCPQF